MKLKSFVAGAVGVLLLLSGQNLVAQEGALPPPDQTASRIPPPDPADTLPPPNPADALPAPAGSASSAGRGSAQGFISGIFSLPSIGRQRTPEESAAGRQPAPGQAGQEPVAGPEGAAAPRSPRRPLPQKGVYLGIMGGFSALSYNTDDTEWDRLGGSVKAKGAGSFGLSLGFDSGLLIFETGTVFAFDNANLEMGSDDTSTGGVSLHIPLLLKADFHLGPVVLQPLLGSYFNFALGKLFGDGHDPYANPPLGLTFGGLIGFNLGGGLLFMDAHYDMDLGKTKAGNAAITVWQRSNFAFTFGYQIYLGRRR